MRFEWEQESDDVGVLYAVKDTGEGITDRTTVGTFRIDGDTIGGFLYNLKEFQAQGGVKSPDLKFCLH